VKAVFLTRNLTAQASSGDVRQFGRLDKREEVFGTHRWHLPPGAKTA
jgi:hypothetical protein